MQAGKKRETKAAQAEADDSAVQREEFLAALKTLEPVPPGEDPNDRIFADEAEEREDQDAVITEIAEGVRSEAAQDEGGKGGAKSSQDGQGDGAVATVESGREVTGGESGGGMCFEELVREVLSQELRRWVEENLEDVTMRVVREELHQMGRRRDRA